MIRNINIAGMMLALSATVGACVVDGGTREEPSFAGPDFRSDQYGARVVVSRSPYWADFTGQHDATSKIQSAINDAPAGATVALGNGTYKISRTLTLKAGVTLSAYTNAQGRGTLVWAGHTDEPMLTAKSNAKIVDVVFDGSKVARIGITMPLGAQGIRVEGADIRGLRGTSSRSAYGIHVTEGSGSFTTPIVLTRSIDHLLTISDIYSPENGEPADSIGASRGIWIEKAHSAISECSIRNIGGSEDGDAIHIQTIAVTRNNSVRDCIITSFGKRAIKAQGDGIKVLNNTIISTKVDAVAGIEFIPGSNNGFAAGNDISTSSSTVLTYGISISGTRHTIVSNKVAIVGTNADTPHGVVNGIMVNMTYRTTLRSNIVKSPFNGIQLLDTTYATLEDNEITTPDPGRKIMTKGDSTNNVFQ